AAGDGVAVGRAGRIGGETESEAGVGRIGDVDDRRVRRDRISRRWEAVELAGRGGRRADIARNVGQGDADRKGQVAAAVVAEIDAADGLRGGGHAAAAHDRRTAAAADRVVVGRVELGPAELE